MQDNNFNKKIIIPKSINLEGVDLNDDYTLPDYIRDIKKLVCCESYAFLHNVFDNGSSMQCEGEVIYNILVICEEDIIKSIVYSNDFNISLPSRDFDVSDMYICCKVHNPQIRLTSPRRINCKCHLNIMAQLSEDVYSGPECSENISGLQSMEKRVSYLCSKTFRELNYHGSHDIELSSNTPEIAEIVCCRVNTNISEIKYMENRLAIRGETYADILYQSTTGEYCSVKKSFAYSEFLDRHFLEGAVCSCNIQTKDIKISVQNNSFGEMRIIELDYSYDIEHKYYCNEDSDMIFDIYSTEYDTKLSKSKIAYKRLNEAFSTALSINESIEAESEIPESVVDCYGQIMSSEIQYDSDSKRYLIVGEVRFDIICRDDNNENERYSNLSYTLPYKYEREARGEQNEVSGELNVNITSCVASLEKGKLHINCELYINAVVISNETAECITGLERADGRERELSPITVYYPKTGEELWDIAKKYRCTKAAIIEANGLSDEALMNVKALIIPNTKG